MLDRELPCRCLLIISTGRKARPGVSKPFRAFSTLARLVTKDRAVLSQPSAPRSPHPSSAARGAQTRCRSANQLPTRLLEPGRPGPHNIQHLPLAPPTTRNAPHRLGTPAMTPELGSGTGATLFDSDGMGHGSSKVANVDGQLVTAEEFCSGRSSISGARSGTRGGHLGGDRVRPRRAQLGYVALGKGGRKGEGELTSLAIQAGPEAGPYSFPVALGVLASHSPSSAPVKGSPCPCSRFGFKQAAFGFGSLASSSGRCG